MDNEQTARSRFLKLVVASAILLSVACAAARAADEDLDELDAGDLIFGLEDLKGAERTKAIERLCKSDEDDAAIALINVLAEPKKSDSAEIIEKAFAALLRLRSKEVAEELGIVMQSPDPVVKGFGIRIYARTYGTKAAKELLSMLRTVRGTTREDLIVAFRDCPSPKVVAAVRDLVKRGEPSMAAYLTLLRLGDASFSKAILEKYASACDAIRRLTEGLKYPSDRRKAARDRTRIGQLIEEKADLRNELALLPKESIPEFAAAAAKMRHQDVYSLLARTLSKLLTDEVAPLYAPLLASPSIEVTTIVVEAIVPTREAAAILAPHIRRLSTASHPELRKIAVRHSAVIEKGQRVALARRLLSDSDKWVRIECMERLADWQVAEVRGEIQRILRSTEDLDVRWSAEYAVSKLGGER